MFPALARRIPFLVRSLLAAAFLTVASSVAVADALVDRIVVRFRDDVVAAALRSLPAAQRQVLTDALRSGFVEEARARDGAFAIALAPPLPVDEARARLNALRMDPTVLYASFAPTPAPPGAGPSSGEGPPMRPTNQIIVRFKDPAARERGMAGIPLDQPAVDRLASTAGAALAYVRAMHDGASVLTLMTKMPAGQVAAMTRRIEALPDVDFAQPDYIDFPLVTPNDPCFSSVGANCGGGYQWDLFDPVAGINMPQTWDITIGSYAIPVAIVDTGGLAGHPDLAGRYVVGYDMIADWIVANDSDPAPPTAGTCFTTPSAPGCNNRDGNASDPGDWITTAENTSGWLAGCGVRNSSFHGTHVAGTIGAIGGNATGVAGITQLNPLQAVRVLGKCGGYASDIADGMTWASGGAVPGAPANPTPARVMNLSLGGSRYPGGTCDAVYQTAITGALARGSVIVVSAGNDNWDAQYSSPANCAGVVTTASTGPKGYRAYYSNWGTLVEIAAPGGDVRVNATTSPNGYGIVSTLNSGTQAPLAGGYNYVQYQGTSMAAPHVTGVAALMLSVNPALTPSQVLAKMQRGSRPFVNSPSVACVNLNSCVPQGVPPNQYCAYAVSSGSWNSCNCTTSTCGAGMLDAYGSVTLALADKSRRRVSFEGNPMHDLSWRSLSGLTSLWLMNGTAYASYATVMSDPNWTLTHTGDLNGDGRTDLVWRHQNGTTAAWLMNGTSYLSYATLLADENWEVERLADFDRNGTDDVLWRHRLTGEYAIWLMNGLTPVGGAVILADPNWRVTHVGDFNGDGRADLVWRNITTRQTALWLMNGAAVLSGAIVMNDANWEVKHVGNFDGNATSDLVWYNDSTKQTAIWLMNGLTPASGAVVLTDPNWQVTHVGDFDGNGRDDLVWRSTSGATNIWMMNGTSYVSYATVLADPNWSVTHVRDLNGDGRSDLVWRHLNGTTVAWLMNGPGYTSFATLLADPNWSVSPANER